jgi:hypothetical protein
MINTTTPTPQVETPQVETQEAETQEAENDLLETERPQRTPEEKQAIYDEMEAARKAACGE